MTATTKRGRWTDRSDERRNRCPKTERRPYGLVQCMEDRREQHVHQNRGRPFEDQTPWVTPTPTVGPGRIWDR